MKPIRVAVFTMHTAEKVASEGRRTRDAHLLRALALSRHVSELVVIDRPATVAERVARRRAAAHRLEGRLQEALGAPMGKLRLVPSVSNASLLPVLARSGWWARAYDPAHLAPHSLGAIRRGVVEADLVITFVPTSHPLWTEASFVLADLLDNWLVHPQLGGRAPAAFEWHYRRTLRNANVVTANSEGTAALARRFGRTATIVPNAVEAPVFRERALAGAETWAHALRGRPRPWLVYAGKMQERVDVQLVSELARSTPGTLIFAGPILNNAWMAHALEPRNVLWVGDLPYEQLPGLVANADVALIPHRVGEGEVGGDPIKVYEYASLGVRSVSTSITGSDRFASLTQVVPRERFVSHVNALGLDHRSVAARIDAARGICIPSWDDRLAELLGAAVSCAGRRGSLLRPSAARG